MSRWLRFGCGLLLLVSAGNAVRADCPALPEINSRLAALPLDEASRTRRFALPVPESLYAKAISRSGTPYPARDGKLVQGVMLSPLPIESWWKAINDDDHHDEKGYLPLRHSEVIKGIPGRGGRETFQFYSSFGIGRWWVNRLEMNEALYRDSEGALWELHWRDALERYPGDEPPVEIGSHVPPIEEAWGAWLLVALGDDCTLVEYVASGEPGGVVGALQWLALTRTLKTTFRGMVNLVREDLVEPHTDTVFHRPDGSPMEP